MYFFSDSLVDDFDAVVSGLLPLYGPKELVELVEINDVPDVNRRRTESRSYDRFKIGNFFHCFNANSMNSYY